MDHDAVAGKDFLPLAFSLVCSLHCSAASIGGRPIPSPTRSSRPGGHGGDSKHASRSAELYVRLVVGLGAFIASTYRSWPSYLCSVSSCLV